MRGLIKGAPPTNVSPPGQEEASLAEWGVNLQTDIAAISDQNARVKHARIRFDSMHKRSLRELLFAEQRFLCIYCERQIDEAQPPPSVSHWNPLSLFLQQAFDWNNLHLSCRTVDTCDDRQRNSNLNLPLPVAFAYEHVLGFTSGGLVYVRSDVAIEPQLRKALAGACDDEGGPPPVRSTLNLNQPALRAAREAAIEAEEVGTSTPTERHLRAIALLSQPRRDGFISARLAFLNGQVGVGR